MCIINYSFFAFIQSIKTRWLSAVVVSSRTNDSEVVVRVPPGSLMSNNLEEITYTHGAQANSAFHTSVVGK